VQLERRGSAAACRLRRVLGAGARNRLGGAIANHRERDEEATGHDRRSRDRAAGRALPENASRSGRGRRRPLKLKIHLDIQAGLDGAITPAELHKALGMYCSNQIYLSHTRTGAWRLDLDGRPAGTVTAEEKAHAKATLAGIEAKKARTAAAKPAAPPTIPQPAKRLSLADLKAAALARKTGLSL
jgi:sRNA-binding protein